MAEKSPDVSDTLRIVPRARNLAAVALKQVRFWLQACEPACLLGVVILFPVSTWSRHLWEQLFARIREKKQLNVPAQIKAVQQKVQKGWLFAETSSGTEFGVFWVVPVIQ